MGSIQRRLTLIIVLNIFFAALAAAALFQVSKTSSFHEFNIRHLQHTLELRQRMAVGDLSLATIDEYERIIENIRQQPLDCLASIGPVDRFLMRYVGAERAEKLCIDDLKLANKTIQEIYQYRQGAVADQAMIDMIHMASDGFTQHSEQFEEPIRQLTRFVSFSAAFVLLFTGVVVVVSCVGVARSLSKTFQQMDRTNLELEETRDRQRELFDQSFDGAVLVDAETMRVADFNQSAYSNLGYTLLEFQQMPLLQFETGLDEQSLEQLKYRVQDTRYYSYETEHQCKDGSVRDILARVNRVSTQRKPYLLFQFHDITERKAAEQALTKSKHELEKRVEERTRELEAKWRELDCLYTISRIVENRANDIPTILRESADALLSSWGGFTLRSVHIRYGELSHYSGHSDPTGNRVSLPFSTQDRVGGDVTVAYSGTEQVEDQSLASLHMLLDELGQRLSDAINARLSEQVLRQARDDAEAGSRAKSSFLATMSHEIRTPMNGIIGMVELLADSRLDDDQRNILSSVKSSAYSLMRIINDILDFSKIEAGRMTLESAAVSLESLVQGVATNLRQVMANKKVELYTFVDPGIPEPLLADAVRLRQVLFNLGGNAVKFTDKGRILIRADLVSRKPGEAVIQFEVIDDGIGIDAERIPRLFEPFTQAEDSTTRTYGGTGLGLSICKRLLDLMGGEITVQSQVGLGSTFRCTIPFKLGSQAHDRSVDDHLQGVSVLVVSPQQESGEFIARYATHWGAQVAHEAVLGRTHERLRRLQETAPGPVVVLFDAGWQRAQMEPELDRVKQHQPAPGVVELVSEMTAALTQVAECHYVASSHYRSAIVSGIAHAAGVTAPNWFKMGERTSVPVQRPEAPSVEQAEALGELILVAEDNEINQDVLARQLHSLGYAADVVANGKEALAAWRQKSYALVLTDCHMPVMDGYQFTTLLRSEGGSRGHTVPIIAITANAMQGEAQRCLEVGMSDYLAKPVEREALGAMLGKWLKHQRRSDDDDETDNENGDQAVVTDTVIDRSVLGDVVGDDDQMFLHYAERLLDSAQKEVPLVHAAVADQAWSQVIERSHHLKSAARTVGARHLADVLQRIEALAKQGMVEGYDEPLVLLSKAVEELEGFVRQLQGA